MKQLIPVVVAALLTGCAFSMEIQRLPRQTIDLGEVTVCAPYEAPEMASLFMFSPYDLPFEDPEEVALELAREVVNLQKHIMDVQVLASEAYMRHRETCRIVSKSRLR